MKEVTLKLQIERNDDLKDEEGDPRFAAFLRYRKPKEGRPDIIYLNVYACMSAVAEDADGTEHSITNEERKYLIITSLMHEFGHALEYHFGLPVNEEVIENICCEWEAKIKEEAIMAGETTV